MPEDANPQVIPIETVGGGNCLFRSLSLCLSLSLFLSLVFFGNEDNPREFRVRTVVELSSNTHLCTSLHTIKEMAEYSHRQKLEYIIQVSISDEAYDDHSADFFQETSDVKY